MKRKVYTYLLCVAVALCCCSCKFEPEADSEQPQVITKQEYFEKFNIYWGFDLPDKVEEYCCFVNNVNDLKAYCIFKVPKEELNIEFENVDSEAWKSKIEYSTKLFKSIPLEHMVDFSHDLLILYQEKYRTQDNIDKLYLIYDNTAQTLTVIDLRT